MKIPLRSKKHPNLFAEIDDEDYPLIKDYKWRPLKSLAKKVETFYAMTDYYNENGKRTTRNMQTMIMGKKKGYVIDHIDGNGLKNTRDNIRFVTVRQNQHNRQCNITSKYPGVSLSSKYGKWHSQIQINGKIINLGLYDNELDAYNAYKKAVENLGESVII